MIREKFIEKSIFLLLAFFLIGCKHKIDNGIVIEKSFIPARASVVLTGKCVVPITYPAMYHLKVRKDSITETFSVSPSVYNRIKIGDSIKFNNKN